MRSHLLHMLLYSSIVALFLSVLFRQETRARMKFGVTVWLVMVCGALTLAYVMYPFPG
jgi:hypothetical protein